MTGWPAAVRQFFRFHPVIHLVMPFRTYWLSVTIRMCGAGLKGVESADNGDELHPVVGGGGLPAGDLPDGGAVVDDGAPAAGAGVAEAGSVGVDDDGRQSVRSVVEVLRCARTFGVARDGFAGAGDDPLLDEGAVGADPPDPLALGDRVVCGLRVVGADRGHDLVAGDGPVRADANEADAAAPEVQGGGFAVGDPHEGRLALLGVAHGDQKRMVQWVPGSLADGVDVDVAGVGPAPVLIVVGLLDGLEGFLDGGCGDGDRAGGGLVEAALDRELPETVRWGSGQRLDLFGEGRPLVGVAGGPGQGGVALGGGRGDLDGFLLGSRLRRGRRRFSKTLRETVTA